MIIDFFIRRKTKEQMAETKQMLFAKNLVCVCVEQVKDGDFSGILYHQYADDPVAFTSAADFLLKMEELMDEWDFPQRGLAERFFKKEARDNSGKHYLLKEGDDRLPIEIIQDMNGVRNVQNKKGTLGTFVVQVVFRQDATWQGHVIHQEKNEKKDFRSALELVKYMDSSINQQNQEAR